MKAGLLAAALALTGCASTQASVARPIAIPTTTADVPFLVSAPRESHFDVFERFFAADYARFRKEARVENATHEWEGWTVSTQTSCEEALERDPSAVVFEDPWFDLGEDTYGEPIAISEFMGTCRLPDDAKASICVAVKDGAAVGVTVSVTRASEDVARCIDRGVRALAFPRTPSSPIARAR